MTVGGPLGDADSSAGHASPSEGDLIDEYDDGWD